jgi:hypothetical protein
MDQVDCVRPGIPVSRFFTPSPPRPLSQRHGGQASKRPVEAAAPAAGMDAPSKSIGGERAHTRLENAPRFPQSLGRVLRSSVPGPRPHLPQAPPQGYFLNGATIPSKVTFLNGLTGLPRNRYVLAHTQCGETRELSIRIAASPGPRAVRIPMLRHVLPQSRHWLVFAVPVRHACCFGGPPAPLTGRETCSCRELSAVGLPNVARA